MTAQIHSVPVAQVDWRDRWLNSKQAASYLAVEVSTLAKWRQLDSGPPYSCALGRDPRYRLSDLENFMLEAVATNTTEAKSIRRATRARRFSIV